MVVMIAFSYNRLVPRASRPIISPLKIRFVQLSSFRLLELFLPFYSTILLFRPLSPGNVKQFSLKTLYLESEAASS